MHHGLEGVLRLLKSTLHLPSLCPSTPGLYLVILADLDDTNRTFISTITPLLAKVSLFPPIPSITLTVLKDHISVILAHSTPCATADYNGAAG